MGRGMAMVNQIKQQCSCFPGTVTRSWVQSFSSLSRLSMLFLLGKQLCPRGSKLWNVVPGEHTKRENKYHFPQVLERETGPAALSQVSER